VLAVVGAELAEQLVEAQASRRFGGDRVAGALDVHGDKLAGRIAVWR